MTKLTLKSEDGSFSVAGVVDSIRQTVEYGVRSVEITARFPDANELIPLMSAIIHWDVEGKMSGRGWVHTMFPISGEVTAEIQSNGPVEFVS